MSKLALIVFSLFMLTRAAHAATVDCTIDYPNGQHAGLDDGTMFYPDGTPLRTIDGEMVYPGGAKLLQVDGSMLYPSGVALKTVDGVVTYASGAQMRAADGTTYTEKGQSVALALTNVVVDPQTKLVVRAFPNGSSYRLYVKTDGNSLIVEIDDQANIKCEFVKPIGH